MIFSTFNLRTSTTHKCDITTVLKTQFELQNINALSLNEMYLDATINVHMTWYDPRLRWEPSEFGHIRQVKLLPDDHIWVPNLLIGE